MELNFFYLALNKIKTNGRKHIKILLHLTVPKLKTLPTSRDNQVDSVPREGQTEDGIPLFKNIFKES